jgi:hypothetical protein
MLLVFIHLNSIIELNKNKLFNFIIIKFPIIRKHDDHAKNKKKMAIFGSFFFFFLACPHKRREGGFKLVTSAL